MKIALLGYGNMGQEIERVVQQQKKDSIVSISFSQQQKKIDTAGIEKADVVIDFTSPELVVDNIKRIITMGKPLVVGTTGWYEKLDEIKMLVRKKNTGFVYGQNFSIGATIFFKILAYSALLVNKFNLYDLYGFEIHHVGKKDSPSGTAKKISRIVLDNFTKKKIVQSERLDRQIKEEEFHFVSIRGGRNSGRHEIIFDSQADAITLSHQAHNRQGFAEGALIAAEFIKSKKGFYSFDDVFQTILSRENV